MNSRVNKQTDALAALPENDRLRLERLAALAKITPEAIWPEVWQYGFDDVEDSVQADIDADEDVAAGRTVSNEEVMAQALRILEAHDKPKRKAG